MREAQAFQPFRLSGAVRLIILTVLCLLSPQLGWAQAVLENPQPHSFQSGIGIISGWACEATSIEIQFDNLVPVEAAYGTSRGDTQRACGDTDNGFGLVFNWNLLGDGSHTVVALADGIEFARVEVEVTTLGAEFVQGVSGEFTLNDFPEIGTDVVVRWQEARQNFVLTDGRPSRGGGTSGSPPAVLENPAPGSFQSGIGIILGWVCEAAGVTIQIDGLPPVAAAYGTSRGDTQGVCGDTDNGFEMLVNWNLLGDGLHTVVALADGTEFARVEVVVTTLGAEFVRGASGEFTLADFPEVGTEVVVQWQEAQQNFVLTAVQLSPTLYWTEHNPGTIRRATLDGSGIETLVDQDSGAVLPYGIALDSAAGELYWTNGGHIGGGKTIQRANLDGSQAEILIMTESSPIGLALDLVDDKLYWTEPRAGKISRASLDGFEIEPLLHSSNPRYLALNLAAGKLYWTSGSTFDRSDRTRKSGSIQRANLDGSEIETLVDHASGARNPQGIALDAAAGKLYWADASKGSLYQANLDGTQVSALPGTEGSPRGLALDAAAGKLYWTDSKDGLYRANLDGSGVELLLEDLRGDPQGIALGVE